MGRTGIIITVVAGIIGLGLLYYFLFMKDEPVITVPRGVTVTSGGTFYESGQDLVDGIPDGVIGRYN